MIVSWIKQIFTSGIKKHSEAFSYFQRSLTVSNAFWGMLLCSVGREKLVEQPDEGCNWGRQGSATCTSSPGREPNCLPMADLILLFALMWHAHSTLLHLLNVITISHFNLSETTAPYTKRLFFLLTLESRGTNNECLLEWVSLRADLGGSRLQGDTLLCHTCNWCCRWWIESRLIVQQGDVRVCQGKSSSSSRIRS